LKNSEELLLNNNGETSYSHTGPGWALLSTPFWGFYEKFLSVTNQRVVRYKILI
jgi:hypothetical protein